MHNGHKVKVSAVLTIGQNIRVPLRENIFTIPADAQDAELTIASRRLKARTKLSTAELSASEWTLFMEDRSFSQEFEWALPKGIPRRQICVVVGTMEKGHEIARFDPNCRSR